MNSDPRNSPSPDRIRRAFRTLAAAQPTPFASPLARAVSAAVLAAAAAPASLLGIAYPFGLALVAAADGGLTAFAAAVGAVLGSLALPDSAGIAAAALFFLAARIAVGWILASPAQNGDAVPLFTRISDRLTRASRVPLPIRQSLAAAAALLSSVITLAAAGGFTAGALLTAFFSAAVTPLAAAAFSAALGGKDQIPASVPRRAAGLLLLLFAVTGSLTAASLPFDAGKIFAFGAPLILARRGSPPGRNSFFPAAAGLVCGLAADPVTAVACGAAGLTAALTAGVPSTASVCAAYIASAAVSFAGGGLAALSASLPEITVTAAILLPLFRFSLIPKPAAVPAEEAGAAARTALRERERAECVMDRAARISDACGDLSRVFSAVSERLRRPGVAELREICETAVDARCQGCENRVLCREREYASSADTLCRITAALHKDGRVTAAVIPPAMAARCHEMDGILTEVNEQCAARTAAAAMGDKTDVISDDYAAFSGILTEAAEGIRADFRPDPALSLSLARALARRDLTAEEITVRGTRRRTVEARGISLARKTPGSEDLRRAAEEAVGCPLTEPQYEIDGTAVTVTMESRPRLSVRCGASGRAAGETPRRPGVSGDTAARLTTADGRYVSIITDGMGTGGEAAVTSRLSVTFLTKMLTAQISLPTALKMLNNYLRARNLECSAGIDVMELDLYTAEARFIKSGAAPSFVIREGRLFRLASKTVPIGILRALDAEMIRFAVRPGDTVVMLSDGVTSGFEESAWLCDLLASPAVMAEEPRKIAERIAAAAAAESRDDITAVVIKVGE